MLAKTPPMGWNTWNTFGCDISERLILECADAFIDNGLREAGYEYLVIDDCWSEHSRDMNTDRLVASHEKFPNGIKAVADYVHSKGLKFGMYSCDGVRTCGLYPGSFDHEFLDAQTFAEWGVDYLKYDNCHRPVKSDQRELYTRMGMALRATGREILYSACNWGEDDVWSWIRSTGANMFRSTGDIFDTPQSYRNIAKSQEDKLAFSAPGCFNDLDMLTVGMYGKGLVGSAGCTEADYRSQFSLWCMYSAPLMLGCDIRSMDEKTKQLVTNRDLISINQDEEGRPPIILKSDWRDHWKVMFKFLSGGEYALAFFNLGEEDAEISLIFEELGMPHFAGYAFELNGILNGRLSGIQREYISQKIPAHDCAVYRVKMVRV